MPTPHLIPWQWGKTHTVTTNLHCKAVSLMYLDWGTNTKDFHLWDRSRRPSTYILFVLKRNKMLTVIFPNIVTLFLCLNLTKHHKSFPKANHTTFVAKINTTNILWIKLSKLRSTMCIKPRNKRWLVRVDTTQRSHWQTQLCNELGMRMCCTPNN